MQSLGRKNFIWNFIGSMFYGFTSLIFLCIVTRINGLNDGGVFSYCFALAGIFFTIGSYSAKTYQITETDDSITDCDYIYNRIFTTIIMIIISIIFGIIMHYEIREKIILILLVLYRGVDVMIDCYHAIIQRNDVLYKAGISLFLRTIILSLVFFVSNLVLKDSLKSVVILLITNISYSLLIDFNLAKNFIKYTKFNKENFIKLLKKGFTIACYYFLAIFVINIPRYLIDFYYTSDIQGIFGIIVMPASFMSLVALYITQPFLNEFVKNIKENKYDTLLKLTYKIIVSIVLIGLLAVIGAYILGIPLLELVYGVDLVEYKLAFMIIVIASIFYSMITMLSGVIVTLRKNILQVIILIIASFLSLIFGYFIVKDYEVYGGSLTYLFIMVIQFSMYFITTVTLIRKEIKK